MKITAKVRCNSRSDVGDPDQDVVTFGADYLSEDGQAINADWARYTPAMSITMNVRKSVPFVAGQAYTLTFDDGE